jgi:hypothetical protein
METGFSDRRIGGDGNKVRMDATNGTTAHCMYSIAWIAGIPMSNAYSYIHPILSCVEVFFIFFTLTTAFMMCMYAGLL